ncbi:MAG: hypothetical protein JW847_06680 [Candidatus Omnitrophica bacterium]|nr:hypothetical protein [Candidatus Omnitrophota bacterium]
MSIENGRRKIQSCTEIGSPIGKKTGTFDIFFMKNGPVKHFFFIAAFFILFSIFHFPFSVSFVQAQEWQEMKSEHFIVYYIGEQDFAKDVLRQSEIYYKRIANELGYQRYSGFWTWDHRVKIYIYPDKETFIKETGQPQWSEGVAKYYEKIIASYAWSEGFLKMLLPHEMTHLIFRDYVGFKGEVPLWLDEGVAQWMEPHKRESIRLIIKQLAKTGGLLSLNQMMRLDVRRSADPNLVQLYYVQAVSLVGFLITEYNASKFTDFCRQLRDGKTVEDALRFSYPISIRSVDELEAKWKKHIMEGE